MIRIKKVDLIDILSFDSPNGNMLSLNDIESLLSYIDIAENDNQIRGIILTGTGRSFSSGLDTSHLMANYSKEKSNHFFKTFDILLLHLFMFSKPVVAAVNGHSIGGGLLIQCCADYVVSSDNPKIKLGLPELKLGLTIDELMKDLLSYNVCNNKTLSKLLYSSAYENPQKYLEYGFIDEVVYPENVINNSLSYIQSILSYDYNAYSIMKQRIKSDCKEKLQRALNNNCFSIFTELLTAKHDNND